MNDQSSKAHEMDVQLKAKTDGISLKVKGAGVFVLILSCIVGVIIVFKESTKLDEPGFMILPLMFLAGIGYRLTAVLAALFNITFIEK
jgi:hypothetical protein